MSVVKQHRRGTTAGHAGFTGAAGEITVDTTKNTAVVHDGATAGGHPLAKESALAGYQPLDADLTAIAALSSNGLVERTGAGTAAIRALGVAAGTSVPTRDDADTRYAAASHTHASGDITGLAAIATSGSASDLSAGTIPDARMPDLTGDVTTSVGAVATTIGANKVLDTMLRDSAGLSVIGRSANSSGDPADIVAANDGDVLRRSGTSVGFGAIPVATITNFHALIAARTALGVLT